ncbi:hypothetical protein SAMN05192541_10523 [Bradyrhizobium arachidis]|nr:hypothetical protein SAMN05192541_10523 [Bradyrhizobium arachidis]
MRPVALAAERDRDFDIEPLGDAEDGARLVDVDPAHAVSRQAADRGLIGEIGPCGTRIERMGSRKLRFGLARRREFPPGQQIDQRRCMLGPSAIEFDQGSEKGIEFRIASQGVEKVPWLRVVGRGGPSGGFEQCAQLAFRYLLLGKSSGGPTIDEDALGGVVSDTTRLQRCLDCHGNFLETFGAWETIANITVHAMRDTSDSRRSPIWQDRCDYGEFFRTTFSIWPHAEQFLASVLRRASTGSALVGGIALGAELHGKKHATACPVATVSRAGVSPRQRSRASGHRAWKAQPAGNA